MPIIATTLSVSPVTVSARIAPIKAIGRLNMMMNGLNSDSNSAAISM